MSSRNKLLTLIIGLSLISTGVFGVEGFLNNSYITLGGDGFSASTNGGGGGGTSAFLLEDSASILLLENNTDHLCLESGC